MTDKDRRAADTPDTPDERAQQLQELLDRGEALQRQIADHLQKLHPPPSKPKRKRTPHST